MSIRPEIAVIRADFKRKLADGTYDPLAERIIKRVRKLFPYPINGDAPLFLVLSLGHFLISCLFFLWDGADVLKRWEATSFLYALLLWAGIFLYARLYRQLYRVVSEHVVDALTQTGDVHDLERLLAVFSNTPVTLLCVFLYAFFIITYVNPLIEPVYGIYKTGGLIASFSAHLASGIIMHHLLFLMLFPLILSRYHIDLYELDPRASPSIRHLSFVVRDSSYQLSLYATAFTLFMFYIMQIPVFPLALIYLIPLLGIFIFRQIALSLIVGRARWTVLERLSAGMEKLDVEHHFDNPAIQNQYKAMLDYYNRVKNAATGVFDARTAVLLFNSLLLPLIAFVLFQFDKLVAFFEKYLR